MGTSNKVKRPPKVFKEYVSILNNSQKLRVRVLQYQHPVLGKSPIVLDIREFVEGIKLTQGKQYTGYTAHGLSLTYESLVALEAILPIAMEKIKEVIETIVKEKSESIS